MTDWDIRYRQGFFRDEPPHNLVEKFWKLIPGERVVDIAMGRGRDALFLAGKGFSVTGLELSGEAIRLVAKAARARDLRLEMVKADSARLPFKKRSFDGVVVFYFLLREAAPQIEAILRSGGILIYETFLKRQKVVDRNRRAEYLLNDCELLQLFPGTETVFYEETVGITEGKEKIAARLVARKK